MAATSQLFILENMENETSTEVEFCEFDYSEFHPLDHWPWQPYCWGWYGGVPRHISLWWDFQAEDQLFSATLCRIGRHRRAKFWGRDEDDIQYRCRHCFIELGAG